jgi:hypothetical protein
LRSKQNKKLAHTHIPSASQDEAGRSQVQNQPSLHSENFSEHPALHTQIKKINIKIFIYTYQGSEPKPYHASCNI